MEYFKVGIITSAHGVKGELKVFPTTDDARRFKKCKSLYLRKVQGLSAAEVEVTEKDLQEYKVLEVKFFKQFVILRLEGIEDRDIAEKLRKSELYVDRDHAVPLAKDEYYIADLIGITVCDEDGNEMGTLTDVLQTGANDVYEVTFSGEYRYHGTVPSQTSVLIPAIKQCILAVNMETRQMVVALMDGMIEE